MDHCYVQDISTRLSVARHLRYRGVGLGVTLPAPPPCRGLIVVLDLWAGFSGTIHALLAYWPWGASVLVLLLNVVQGWSQQLPKPFLI